MQQIGRRLANLTTTIRLGAALCDDIDRIIEGRSLLRHPFYQAWQAGTLTLDALRGYACQYYHHVLAFPTYVSGAHANCADLADRQFLLENLIEEERGPENHPELWLRFAEGLGLTRQEVMASRPLPETSAAIATYRTLTKDRPFIEGITALYAYERQVPDVAVTKIAGLNQFYGISAPRDVAFFTVHQQADVWHSAVTRELIAKYAVTEDAAQSALLAATEAAGALWTLLDGVYDGGTCTDG
jgi:pyrroloquinoline-quinone synthase